MAADRKSSRAASQQQKEFAVYCNVYDLHTMNEHLFPLGLGIYHSAIEINGREWSYGGNSDYEGTGIFYNPARSLDFNLRETILIGTVLLNSEQFLEIIRQFNSMFIANQYDMIYKNCNSFTNDFAKALVGRGIPNWVNRMAFLGRMCSCCVPRQIPNDLTSSDSESLPNELETDNEPLLMRSLATNFNAPTRIISPNPPTRI